ncbi:uncharacterized protein A4U43_C09F2240 [Asparagus officinalis]|uniref:BRCT domain-containing protein n=1 Tax=Asparagus officinalis TaxID=4686 RepID=A0A5P1E566_ASPOF|nr:uncharacterized protein A4U43_C09F2240 [Asparagus officinalis]
MSSAHRPALRDEAAEVLSGRRRRREAGGGGKDLIESEAADAYLVLYSLLCATPEVYDAVHDALKLNGANVFLCCDPSRNNPDDFHVISSSDHEKFEVLKSKGCNLLGPQCILSCAKEHRILPKQGYTCCLAMDGVKVLASGFERDKKVTIEKLVTAMGGILQTRASLDVNFVVVKDVLAAKYKYALNVLKKPILDLNWLHRCWSEHRVVPQEPFRILPFTGLTICVTRIPPDERKEIEKLIVQNGGRYSADLTKKCTHLVSDISFITIICCLDEGPYAVDRTPKSCNGMKTLQKEQCYQEFSNVSSQPASRPAVEDLEATLEKREVRRLAAWGVIHVVKSSWLEECDRTKKELSVSSRHVAVELLFSKDRSCNVSDIKKATSSTYVPCMPIGPPTEGKLSAAQLIPESRIWREKSGNHVNNGSYAEAATKYDPLAQLPAMNNERKNACRMEPKSYSLSAHNSRSSDIFKGKSFCFSRSFPTEQRDEVIRWINEGGGMLVDDQRKKNADFIVERHGLLQSATDVSHSIVVSTHWIRSSLDDGCMLDIQSHIIYSPLCCHIPLPGFECLRFCVSQYEEKDRLLLKNLSVALGAKFSSKLTKKSTHLICKFTNGPKYEAACNWGIQSVTAEWLTECITQDKMVPPDAFRPRPVTVEDKEAGLCTVSQYPTQAANMVSGPQQLLSQSQGPMSSLKGTTVNSSTFGKRQRLPESNNEGDASKKSKVPEDVKGGSNSIPDVADAIEDLLAQSNLIQDMKLPGTSSCDQSIFSSDHSSILGQNHPKPRSTYDISRLWLNRTENKELVPNRVGHEGKVGGFDSFSETQTESQVVGYEEDLTGRQKIIDRVRSQNLTLTPDK